MELKPGYKKTEVGVIPENWNCSALGNLCDTSSGTTPSRSLIERYFRGGTINWVKTLDLNNSVIFSTDECVTEAALNETSLRVYPKNTVLVAMYGGFNQIGRTGILSIPACVNQAITAVRCGAQLDAGYLLATLNFKVEYWKSVASSSRKDPNITSKDIRDFIISYPPKAEQQAIAEALSNADALIESLDQLIAKKRQIKQGAMQELLTGKRRLPGFSGEWLKKSLGDLGEFLKGAGVSKDEALTGDLPCIRYGEIYTKHSDWIREFQSWVSTAVAATATRINYGDVLFAASGETKEEIGKCVAYVDQREAYAGGDIVILRTKIANPLFLGYYLNTESVRQQKSSRGQGDAVVHIGANSLAAIKIALPSMEEQTAIATILSDMDTELAALESRLAKARQIKQGMMQELLTGRIRLL